MSHNPLTNEELESLLSELEACGIYGRQVRALAELQERREADKSFFMYGIAEPDGSAYIDEVCVSHDLGLLEATVDELNINEGTNGYRVVALQTTPPFTVIAELGAAINALLDMQVRMVKQTNHGACFYDAETISAMNYAPIQAKQALELAKLYK
ncbi:hypothetical protein HV079_15825 [Citrobacter freundii]|uniref:hypothetical protein n=1 Tax=Citrobacter freundii TaxID=546 RepID=UPI0015EA9F4F|nr:hypothetical protein [Citrobacter freundii]QLZ60526.1 hypothetical protein HV079_15825 [Citrobacter freundii]